MGRTDPARLPDAPHEPAHRTTPSPDALAAKLAARLGRPLEVRVTDNARAMLSVRHVGGVRRVRAHAMFVDAPDDVLDAAARYLAHGDRAAGERLDAYIRANAHRVRPRAPRRAPGPRGKAHDLAAILAELLRAHCPAADAPTIAWGAARASRRRGRVRTIRLGVYRYDARAIEIHPCLDAPWVPRYFVAWVVFHELMHHVAPGPEAGGRRRHHHADFRALEARFPERELALAWERANLRRLVAARDG
ncbi:MAG: hypothetical protein U0324_17875 [Polyangiales bacterium]